MLEFKIENIKILLNFIIQLDNYNFIVGYPEILKCSPAFANLNLKILSIMFNRQNSFLKQKAYRVVSIFATVSILPS